MDLTAREMTLDEWVDRLPPIHAARKERDRLRAENALLRAECAAWREADAYADMLGVMAGDYDKMDPTGYGHREVVRTARDAVDAAGIKLENP